MKKKIMIAVAVLVLLAAGAAGGLAALRGPQVEAFQITEGPFRVTFTEEGTVTAPGSRDVSTLYTATVAEVLVTEGQQVAEGDILVRLEDMESGYALAEMEAQLKVLDAQLLQLNQGPGTAQIQSQQLQIEQARLALDSARKEESRIQALYEAGAVPKAELERAQLQVRLAGNQLSQQEKALQALRESYQPGRGSREAILAQKEALEAQMERMKWHQGQMEITAPADGLVAGLMASPGDVAGPQMPLMTLLDPSSFRVEVMVLAEDVPEVFPGMEVELTLPRRGGDQVFAGTVESLSPRAEAGVSSLGLTENRVKVTVRPRLPEEAYVAPGFSLEVTFLLAEEDKALTVPRTAVYALGDTDHVLAVREGRLTPVPVVTGLEDRSRIQIREGLTPGDVVVINPPSLDRKEGDRVRPVFP